MTELTSLSPMESILEQWRPITDWSGWYEVSDQGRVRSLDRDIPNSRGGGTRRMRGRILKPKKGGNNDYLQVTLSRGNNENQYRAVSCLVLEAFVGPRPEGMQAAHGNGNTFDNSLSNLRWATPRENAGDKRLHGTHLEGESVWKSILTEEQVAAIRLKYRRWGYLNTNRKELAEKYGISSTTVSHIVCGRTWRYLDPPVAPAQVKWTEENR